MPVSRTTRTTQFLRLLFAGVLAILVLSVPAGAILSPGIVTPTPTPNAGRLRLGITNAIANMPAVPFLASNALAANSTGYPDLTLPPPAPNHIATNTRGSADYFVWVDRVTTSWGPAGEASAFALDLHTGEVISITYAPQDDVLPALSGWTVIWSEHGHCEKAESCRYSLLGEDLNSRRRFIVTSGIAGLRDYAIAGKSVAWVEANAAEQQVKILDLDGKSTAQVIAISPQKADRQPVLTIDALSDDYLLYHEAYSPWNPRSYGTPDTQTTSPGREPGYDYRILYDRKMHTSRTLEKRPSKMPGDGCVFCSAYRGFAFKGHTLIALAASRLNIVDLDSNTRVEIKIPNALFGLQLQGNYAIWGGARETDRGQKFWGIDLSKSNPMPVELLRTTSHKWNATLAGAWIIWQEAITEDNLQWRATRIKDAFSPGH